MSWVGPVHLMPHRFRVLRRVDGGNLADVSPMLGDEFAEVDDDVPGKLEETVSRLPLVGPDGSALVYDARVLMPGNVDLKPSGNDDDTDLIEVVTHPRPELVGVTFVCVHVADRSGGVPNHAMRHVQVALRKRNAP